MLLVIEVRLENTHGALMRVAGIITSKAANIASLFVAPEPFDPGTSRMVLSAEIAPDLRARVVSQIERLVNVLSVVDITSDEACGSAPRQPCASLSHPRAPEAPACP